MGLNCPKTTEPLQGGKLIFVIKFPEIPGTHLIDLGMMKAELTLEPCSDFEHRNYGLGIQCLNLLYYVSLTNIRLGLKQDARVQIQVMNNLTKLKFI